MKPVSCYPPAETKIPFSSFLAAIGPKRMNFGEALCRYLGTDHCLLANSGRSLLYTLLSALKSDPAERREVLVPGYTCYSVAAAVSRAGLKIRPYDLEPDTLLPEMDTLRKLGSERTLAIIVQHLFGMPTPLTDIRKIARAIGAVLIEDAAQALGGKMNGRLLGTDGDYGLFSFGRGKPLPLGSGGALIGDDPVKTQCLHLNHRTTGILQFAVSAATQVASKPYVYGIAEMLPIGLGETVFDPDFEVASMGALMANLGVRSLGYLAALNAHRQGVAGIYRKELRQAFTIPQPDDAEPVYPRFPLLLEPGPIPEKLRYLGVRRMYPKAVMDEKSIAPFLAAHSAATPGAAQVARNLVTLPTHKGISERSAALIAKTVNRCYS